MSEPRTWTIPLAVEDGIALDHLGQTLTGRESLSMTATVRQMQAALDAAYQAGWRQGMTERGAAIDASSFANALEQHRLRHQ
jgi:hypothetical protein